jgi:hypothetical protein
VSFSLAIKKENWPGTAMMGEFNVYGKPSYVCKVPDV